MAEGNEQQLRFHPIDGCTVRADFDGGAMSSDFGPMLLRSVDRQTGLSDRLAAAIADPLAESLVGREVTFAERCLDPSLVVVGCHGVESLVAT